MWNPLVSGGFLSQRASNVETVCSTACSDQQQRNHQPSPIMYKSFVHSLCRLTTKIFNALHNWPFVKGIHWWLVDSPHKGPVMCQAFPRHYIIMQCVYCLEWYSAWNQWHVFFPSAVGELHGRSPHNVCLQWKPINTVIYSQALGTKRCCKNWVKTNRIDAHLYPQIKHAKLYLDHTSNNGKYHDNA